MKNAFTSLTAIMLVVWYSLSVIGFDVHTCSGSGQTYIATVASGFSCEDIHPETHVHTGCRCCHSDESETAQFGTKPCCSDDFQVIVLTGVRGSQEQDDRSDGMPMQPACARNHTACTFNTLISGLQPFHKPRSGDIVPRDVMVSYNIWRI